MVCFEFYEEGIEGFEKVVGCCRVRCGGCCRVVLWVNVENWRDGEPKEEVVGCAAGEFGGGEVGEFGEVWSGEMDGVKPKNTAFVAGSNLAQNE